MPWLRGSIGGGAGGSGLPLPYPFPSAPAFSPLGGPPANCTAVIGGCQACLDFGRAAAGGGSSDGGSGCVWCPQEGGCVSAFACLAPADTCTCAYACAVTTALAQP